GFDDVLFVDVGGQVVEGATWNVGFLDGKRLIWPEADWLPSVTMRLVQDALPGLGLVSATARVGQAELARMRAAFITNATVGVRASRSIADIAFAEDDPTIQVLQNAYRAIRGELV